jgi:hypothetical protein
MSETETTTGTLVREREVFPFPKLEFPPLVAEAVFDPAPDTGPQVTDDAYVPDDIEQRLIYYWLSYGPKDYNASIVTQAPPPTPPVYEAPVINPLQHPPRPPRVIGFNDDGVRRAIVFRP